MLLPLYMQNPSLIIRNLLFFDIKIIQSVNYLQYLVIIILTITISILFSKTNKNFQKIFIISFLIIFITWLLYKLPQTNPDIASYLYFGKYVEKYGVFNFFINFSSPKIDSWVSAPLIGIYTGLIGIISGHNYLLMHIFNMCIFFILCFEVSKIVKNNNKFLLFILIASVPFLMSQSYLFLTDILSTLFFIMGFRRLEAEPSNKALGYFFLLISFLTKYLLIMYIVPYLLFKIITRNKTEKLIWEILLIISIIGWIIIKPRAFYVLFFKTLFEKTPINNALFSGFSNIFFLIAIGVFLTLIFIYLTFNPITINFNRLIVNKKHNKLFIFVAFLILFFNIELDIKTYFYRTIFIGTGPIFVIFLLYLYDVIFNKNYKNNKIDFYVLFFCFISLFTPNLMFKYLIPIYPFICLGTYLYISKHFNKNLNIYIYLCVLTNLSFFCLYYLPMIKNNYDNNFIKVSEYIQKNSLDNINIMFIENTNHGKSIRNYDFSLPSFVGLYLSNKTKLFLIDMKYSVFEGNRQYAIINYGVKYEPKRNLFENIYPSIELENVINNKLPILLICDFNCNSQNDGRVDSLNKSGYNIVFESPYNPNGSWRNKSIVYEKI